MRRCGVGVALALWASTSLALADGKVPPLAQSLRGDAAAEYDRGRQAFAKADFAAALASFRRAYDLSHDPRLLWNTALTERKLGHLARAARAMEAYLATGGSLLSDADRSQGAKFVDTLREQLGAVRVTSDPPGATVRIDDDVVGTTPLATPVLVDPGRHRVAVSLDGHDDARDAEVASGTERAVTFDLGATPPAPSSAAPERSAPPPPASAPEPEAPPPPSKVPLVLGAVGAGVAILGGGLVIASSARYAHLENSCGTSCAPSSYHAWPTVERTGDVLLAVGGATFASGVALWLLSPPSSTSSARVFVAPHPGGLAVGRTF